MTKKWGTKLYEAGLEWGKLMGKIIFSISPFQEWRKIMGKRSKLAIFPHYWNGEKEWGKNIDNGEKLLMKMGKILSWILIERLYEIQQERLIDVQTGDMTDEQYKKLEEKINNKLAHLHLVF